jgi:hypothetical protein
LSNGNGDIIGNNCKNYIGFLLEDKENNDCRLISNEGNNVTPFESNEDGVYGMLLNNSEVVDLVVVYVGNVTDLVANFIGNVIDLDIYVTNICKHIWHVVHVVCQYVLQMVVEFLFKRFPIQKYA